MKILSVKGKNLLSLGDFELVFSDSGLVLVEGWNYDDGRANGAGKTAIFNLMCLAIFQKIPRKITMSEVVKRGEKRGEVNATILAGADTYTLFYGRPKRRIVQKNGIQIDITQEELESAIGLTYEQFLTSMYAVQGGGNRFLNKNDTEKKEFLLQLQNLNEFMECRKEVSSRCKELEKEISDISIKIGQAHSKLEVYKESQVDTANISTKLESLTKDIKTLNLRVLENQQIGKPDLSKFYKLEEQIKDKHNNFFMIRADKNRLHADFANKSASISSFISSDPDDHCPACSVALSVKNNTVVVHSNQSALRDQHEASMDNIRFDLDDIKSKIDKLDKSLYKEGSIKELEVKIRDKKDRELASYSQAQADIQNCNLSIQNKNSQKDRLNQDVFRNQEIEEKMSKLNIFVNKANMLLNEKNEDLDLHREIMAMYSPTGAPAYVMDSIVESFNDAVNQHIGLVWPSASYQLKSYKEKKTGDLVAKFSETLIINGHITSIGALSGGEERAFSLSIDFAIADILSKQFGMPLNPIVMDEPFEGLDATGREVVVELLEKLAVNRQIFVIDHASEAKSMFSQILRVEKRNDTSVICDT